MPNQDVVTTANISPWTVLSDAYGFAARNYFAVLGIAWLPHALVWGMTFALVGRSEFIVQACVFLGSLLLHSMVEIGVTALAMDSAARRWAFFSLDARVWRLALRFLAIAGAVGGIGMALGLAVMAVGLFLSFSTLTYAWLIVYLPQIAILLAFPIFARTLLLAPVIVLEPAGGIGRSWVLTRGKVLQTLAVFVGVWFPIIALRILDRLIGDMPRLGHIAVAIVSFLLVVFCAGARNAAGVALYHRLSQAGGTV